MHVSSMQFNQVTHFSDVCIVHSLCSPLSRVCTALQGGEDEVAAGAVATDEAGDSTTEEGEAVTVVVGEVVTAAVGEAVTAAVGEAVTVVEAMHITSPLTGARSTCWLHLNSC
jgi:acetyl/propionyl-CoA carboxylase alpha subunit